MSRIKNPPSVVWLVIGVLVTLLVVPTAAVAAGLKITEVEGTSTHVANVTSAGQLLTTEANPRDFFQNANEGPSTSGVFVPVAVPPSPYALVVTTVHLDTYADPTPGFGQYAFLVVETGTSCTGSDVGSYFQILNPGGIGEIDIPVAPGLGIPSGDALCAESGGSVGIGASVSGYTVPASAVTAGPLHSVAALPQQH
jgi:hypothetical protein